MRSHVITAVAGLCSLAPAQDNRFEVYPDTAGLATTLSDRAPLGVNRGELLQQYPGDAFKGIGSDGTSCQVTRAVVVLQDQDGATQESFFVIARRVSGSGPDASTAGLLARVGPLSPPPAPPGPTSWVITVTFPAHVAVPCEGSWFVGVELGPNAMWNSDGLSVHGAAYPPNGSVGDNPRASAPNLAWAIDNNGVVQARSPQVLHLAVGTVTPILAMGSHDPSSTRIPTGTGFGAGGIYPDVSGAPRSDGISARIRATRQAGGFALLFTSYQPGIPGGAPVPGVAGRFYINPNLFYLGTVVVGPLGEVVLPIAAPGTLPVGLTNGTLFFQALCADPTFVRIALTNAAHQRY